MIIQKINSTTYNNHNKNRVSFCSNRIQDEMMRKLYEKEMQRFLEAQAKRREEEAIKKQKEMDNLNALKNYQIDDESCQNMAQFLLNFACSIENDSKHDINEFFKPEEEAAELRKKLSPECQKNSIELRKGIQSQPIFKNPALTLIAARNMKEFVPVDEEFAKNKEYQQTINAAKNAIVDLVEFSDKSNFDKVEIGLTMELTEIIKKTEGLDFGEEYDEKLQELLDSIKNKQQIKIAKKGVIAELKRILNIK